MSRFESILRCIVPRSGMYENLGIIITIIEINTYHYYTLIKQFVSCVGSFSSVHLLSVQEDTVAIPVEEGRAANGKGRGKGSLIVVCLGEYFNWTWDRDRATRTQMVSRKRRGRRGDEGKEASESRARYLSSNNASKTGN